MVDESSMMTIKKIMLFNQANENGFLSVGINVKYHPMRLIAVENMMGCNAASLYRVNAKYHPITLLAPQSGALRISAYRDSHPIPLIAFEHLSLSIVI